MTPERMAALVARWVRRYTRDLPAPVAERRVEEIDADLHDHVAHERGRGTADWRIALSIAARMLRGLPADASWRSRTLARFPNGKEVTKMRNAVHRSVARVALVTTAILLVPAAAMVFSEEANWGLGDFLLAAVLLAGTGFLLELAAARPGSVAFRAATAGIGVAAIAFGEVDDAPGLVLFGGLLIVGTVVLGLRTVQRSP
jgi:hypothetical protein